MQLIFHNEMRTVWRKGVNHENESWSEIRKYSSKDQNLPTLPQKIVEDNSIYWGDSDSHTFRIGSHVKENFWDYFSRKSFDLSAEEKSRLIFFLSDEMRSNLPLFSDEAEKRYLPEFTNYVQHLPRDIRELHQLISDPIVADSFNKAGISIDSVIEDIRYFEDFSRSSSSIVHGCFRFRNIGFTQDEKMLVLSGDDFMHGVDIIPMSALLADLFELRSSKVLIVEKTLFSLYEETTAFKEEKFILDLNKFIFLYVISHYAQFLFTHRKKVSLRILKDVSLFRESGLPAVF